MNGLRLCAACDDPSPGPLKRLYYQQRPFGPYFPVLEERRKLENSNLYSEGKATVCTSCASHFQRQWAAYDKKWTPIERRFYKLRSVETTGLKHNQSAAKSDSDIQEHTQKQSWKSAAKHVTRKANVVSQFNDRGSPGASGRGSNGSGASDDYSPFQRAVKRVAKQNKPHAADDKGLLTLQAVIEEAHNKGMLWNGAERIRDRPDGGMAPDETNASKASLLWKLPKEIIRSHVRDEMEESIEIMIRKLAEIQHLENVRRTEHALKEAADQLTKARDRDKDIDRMAEELKSRFRQELSFRDTGRVLRDEKVNSRGKDRGGLELPEGVPQGSLVGITAAKRAGKTWKSKNGKSRNEKSLLSSRTQLEKIPESETQSLIETELERRKQEAQNTQKELQVVKEELAKEREWRKKTEGVIAKQTSMINELREGIHGEIERLMEEQATRHQELKESFESHREKTIDNSPRSSPPDNLYNSREGEVSRNRKPNVHEKPPRPRHQADSRSRDQRSRWRETEDNTEDDDDDDEYDDDSDESPDDDADDARHGGHHGHTRPETPAYYIK